MNLQVYCSLFIMPQSGPFLGKAIKIDSVKDYSITCGWDEMMTTGQITVSRNMKNMAVFDVQPDNILIPSDSLTWVDDNQQNTSQILATQSIFGGFNGNTDNIGLSASAIQRGDIIAIAPLYGYIDQNNEPILSVYNVGKQVVAGNADYAEFELYGHKPSSQIFTGYITSIKSGYEIKIQVADFMYFFQQLTIPNAKFTANKFTINKMIATILDTAATSYSKNKANNNNNKLKPIWGDTQFVIANYDAGSKYLEQNSKLDDDGTVGDILCENATVGMVFKELKNRYQMVPFFYPNSNWLNILPFKYNDEEFGQTDGAGGPPDTLGWQFHTFAFQKNIISSNLDYRKKEDVLVGAYIKSQYKIEGTKETLDGKTKTRITSLQYFVGDEGGNIFTYFYDRKDIVPKTDADATKKDPKTGKSLEDRMKARGKQLLAQNVYTGYYGSFTTFGHPYVRHGDKIQILDNLFPERNGFYRVKKVRSFGGETTGLRQEIFLDIKTSLTIKDNG